MPGDGEPEAHATSRAASSGWIAAIGRRRSAVRNAPRRLPPIPVSRIGRPPGSTRASPIGEGARGDGDGELDARADERHEQREEREREDEVDAELLRDRGSRHRAGTRRAWPGSTS